MNRFFLVKESAAGSWDIEACKGRLSKKKWEALQYKDINMPAGEMIEQIEPDVFYWKKKNVTFVTYRGWSDYNCEQIQIDYIKILKETIYE